MLQGYFQRASMAILLMGLVMMPLGFCRQLSSKSAHSCCMHSQSAQSLGPNCCVVRAQLPATLPTPTLPLVSLTAATHEYAPSLEALSPDGWLAVASIPPLSPPPGAFALRI